MPTTEQLVTRIIAETYEVDQEQVTREASLMDDLGGNEDTLVELVLGLEGEFGFEIEDEDAEKWQTVGNVIDYIESQV